MAGATELPDRTATLVIGAGILGCSIAYHLTQRGLDDVVVVDRGPLPATGGPSPDAPSGVFQTAPSETESTFAQETRSLAAAFDAYEETGSVEVATTDAHLGVLDRRMDQATVWGVDGAERLSPGAVADRLPLVDGDRLLGGYYVPTDGRVARVELIEALRERATEQGATFCGTTTVEDITTAGGRDVLDGRGPAKRRSLLSGPFPQRLDQFDPRDPPIRRDVVASEKPIPVDERQAVGDRSRTQPLRAVDAPDGRLVHPPIQDPQVCVRGGDFDASGLLVRVERGRETPGLLGERRLGLARSGLEHAAGGVRTRPASGRKRPPVDDNHVVETALREVVRDATAQYPGPDYERRCPVRKLGCTCHRRYVFVRFLDLFTR